MSSLADDTQFYPYVGRMDIPPVLSISPGLRDIHALAGEIDVGAPYKYASFETNYAHSLIDLGTRSYSIPEQLPRYGGIRSLSQIVGLQSQNNKLNTLEEGSFPMNAPEYLYSNLRYQVLRLLAISRDDSIQATRASLFYLAYEINNLVAYRETSGISYQQLGLPYVANMLRLAYQQQPTDHDRIGIAAIRSLKVDLRADKSQYLRYFDYNQPRHSIKGAYINAETLEALSGYEKTMLYRHILYKNFITRDESPLVYVLLDSLINIYEFAEPIIERERQLIESEALFDRTREYTLALSDATYLKELADLMIDSIDASIDGKRDKVFGFLDEV